MGKHWFYGHFKDYVRAKGHHVLKDDYRFIEDSIKNMPENEQKQCMRNYLDEWNRGVAGTEKNRLKQNYGRFRANTWLRLYVEDK